MREWSDANFDPTKGLLPWERGRLPHGADPWASYHGHEHTPAREEGPYAFVAPVFTPGVTAENPRAHGGVVWVEHCRCGARRRVAANLDAREYSAWQEPVVPDPRFIGSQGGGT